MEIVAAEAVDSSPESLFTERLKSFYSASLGQPFMSLVAASGVLLSVWASSRIAYSELGLPFLLLATSAILFGSQAKINVPRFKTSVSISDVFIFLAILLFGGEAAVLLAATESYFSSLQITKRPLTRLFNAGSVAISTFMASFAVRQVFGEAQKLSDSPYLYKLALAACLMGVVQYLANSALVATAASLRTKQTVYQVWKTHYKWILTGYLAAALAAAAIARLDSAGGAYALLATAPIVGVVYLTFRTYLKNVEANVKHSEQRERYLTELGESEERFRSAFDMAPIGMALVSTDGKWLRVNRSLCGIVGYNEDELLGQAFTEITFQDDRRDFESHVAGVVSGDSDVRQMEKRYVDRRGNLVWVHVSISMIRETQKQPSQLIFQIQHIADRKRAEERLIHDALHDSLTGLPNRVYFMERLTSALADISAESERTLAVLFLDLDRFKVINDSIGHLYGDKLLMETATRISSCIRSCDLVARLGGDEFTVLLTGVQSEVDVIRVAGRIQREISVPLPLGSYETCTTASIGIALYRKDYKSAEEMLRDADTAMYHAKSLGKNQYAIFDRYMHARAMSVMQIETDLRRALEREEFVLNYQSIVDLETGRLLGFEALVRWRHPERGMISPAMFIPVAEETGCIVPLGQWVLREACSQMKLWQEQFAIETPLYISVNISSKQFGQVDLPDQVVEILRSTGLSPRSLKLEITESVVMDNIEVATRILERLQAIGIELSIDDFGTGYSSLSYLHRLPINTLKIDRSFVSRLGENKEDKEIVRTIIMMAQILGKGVVAEGVETTGQIEHLRELHCESAQGYYFSKPLDSEAAGQLIWNAQQEWQRGLAESNAPEPELSGLVNSYRM